MDVENKRLNIECQRLAIENHRLNIEKLRFEHEKQVSNEILTLLRTFVNGNTNTPVVDTVKPDVEDSTVSTNTDTK